MESNTPATEKFTANKESIRGIRESDLHSVLLHVNGCMLPGFDDEHIRFMGQTNSPGVRVQVLIGVGTAPLLVMKLQIKCGESWHLFAIVGMPLKETGIPLSADLLDVADTAMMKTMFSIPPTYMRPTTVVDPVSSFDFAGFGPDGPQYHSFPPRESIFIQPAAIQIIRVTAVTKAGELYVNYPSPFWQQIHRQSIETRTIARQIKSFFSPTNKDSQISFWITFPFYPEWRRDWQLFFGDEHKGSPYGKVAWEQHQTNDSADSLFPVLLLPFPGSEWTPADNDKQEYGMAATGLPTAYFMVVNAKRVLPDIGAVVKVYLQVAQGYFPLPQQPLTALQIRKIAAQIQDAIKGAESKSRGATEIAQARLDGLREKEAVAKDTTHLVTELFLEVAAKSLLPYISKLSNKAKAQHPNGPEDAQRWVDALQVASQLRVRNGENDNAHVKRITKWVKSQGVVLRPPQPNEHGEPFLGCRLSPPPGIHEDMALFHIEVPRQPNWPRGFKQPPMRIAVPKSACSDDKESIEVKCFAIHALDNLDFDSTEGARLESILKRIAGVITKTD